MVFYHNLNPILLDLGPLQIRWYGIMYVIAFVITYFYLKWASDKGKIKLTISEIESFLAWIIVGMLIGARVFEVLFYNLPYYLNSPLKVFAIWQGGLSFHGGLVGIIIVSLIYCYHKKINFLNMADILSVPAILGQALGRIGNFINGELPGRITSLPWGTQFPGFSGFRHPSQLYEMGYDFVIFGILFFKRNKNYKHGTIFALFLILYSFFRFFTEFVREPTTMVGVLTMGQALNVPMFIFGIWLIWWVNRK